jgi:hypothetical protein
MFEWIGKWIFNKVFYMSGLEQRVQDLEQQNRLLSSRLESILGKIKAFDNWKDQSSITMGLFQKWYNENVKPYHIT